MKHNNCETVLWEAACAGNVEKIASLLAQGVRINAKDHHGSTALMYAAENGRTITVKLLLNYGASINDHDNNGSTALVRAADAGYSKTVELLLDHWSNNTLNHALATPNTSVFTWSPKTAGEITGTSFRGYYINAVKKKIKAIPRVFWYLTRGV